MEQVPLSALSEDAFKIASGSATASISPNLGFVVNTSSSIQGDLSVSGRITAEELFVNFVSSSIIYSSGSNILGDDSGSDIQKIFGETRIFGNVSASALISSSGFVGDGSELFNIPQSALAETSPLIASGSITASTFNNQFTVTSIDSGSVFFGDVKVQSGSAFSGSGKDLFDIPQSALTEAATLIASGSVTASVDPNKGFEVNSTGRFDGTITTSGSLIVSASANWAPDNLTKIVKVIGTDDGNKYEIDGYQQPLLYLVNGSTYKFNQADVTNATHEIRFSIIENGTHGGGTSFTGSVDTGSIAAGNSGSEVSIQITNETPTPLYYYCLNHSNMGGVINKVVDYPITKTVIKDTFIVSGSIIGVSGISGSFSGSGRDLFDIPLSALATNVEELSFIASGSVTASTDPSYGFKVNTSSSIEGVLNYKWKWVCN